MWSWSLSIFVLAISVYCPRLTEASLYLKRFENSGAPCTMQHTLRPSRTLHGPPRDIEAPFQMTVKDLNGTIVKYYEPEEEYFVELTGHIKFRGFLLQPRLASRDGFLIGHLRGGHFIPEEIWTQYGAKIQRCGRAEHNSVTHSNFKQKFLLKLKWTTNRFVGPVQFYATIFQNDRVYWQQWQPRSAFLLPKPRFSVSDDKEGLPKLSPLIGKIDATTAVAVKSDDEFNEGPLVVFKDRKTGFKVAPRRPIERPAPPPTSAEPAKDFCTPNPCFNDGKCANASIYRASDEDGFVCTCKKGWMGSTCLELDHCASHDCEHGSCKNDKFGYSCECDAEWVGEKCERECPAILCQQGGTCTVNEAGGYACICPPGYSGRTCGEDIDDCEGVTCMNGASCIDKVNDFECECPVGYMGKLCHRACQDIYKTCDLWRRQDHCVVSKGTNFFDINCANSCGRCNATDDTITTDAPIPPLLEPFAPFVGRWEADVKSNVRFPHDFWHNDMYSEVLTIHVTKPPMFGNPYLNVTAIARSTRDPENIKSTKGFLTLRIRPRIPRAVALMTTGNEGTTVIEEGVLKEDDMSMSFTPQHVITMGGAESLQAGSTEREYKIDGTFLREKITRIAANGDRKQNYKFFFKTESYKVY